MTLYLTTLALSALVTSVAVAKSPPTKTPIKHLIVIFQENRAFDHYFATYPNAQNNPGEVPFYPRSDTPWVNNLNTPLLTENKNAMQPFRFSPSDQNPCVPDHDYTALQQSCDSGLMDQFVQTTGSGCGNPNTIMGYYDGNTVTAYWNYAQHFAMSDNFHLTNIGESTAGALNLISGQTHGIIPSSIPGYIVDGTIITNLDPTFDMCSDTDPPGTVQATGLNVGNLLNNAGVTWGWFQGGFANCSQTHIGPDGITEDYVPHHNPFQYYESTSNPLHLPPTSPKMVGKTDQANHIYDLTDFWAAAEIGNVPSVCFFKAPQYQNEHGESSNPALAQQFLTNVINKLQTLPQWKNMAIIITFDDSGGWYDHEMPPIVNQSQIPEDALVGPGSAGPQPPLGGYQGRPGYGFRVPFVLISPWAKINFVDSTLTDQSSILRFIEDNWSLGGIGNFSFDSFAGTLLNMFDFKKCQDRHLFLDPNSGSIIYRSGP